MREPDDLQGGVTPETTWKLMDEGEKLSRQTAITNNELCDLARSEEKTNVFTYWFMSVALACIAASFLYNVFFLLQPWIRLGSAWTLGVICYLFGAHFQHGARQRETSESCAHFLQRELEGKRNGFLAWRRGLSLFIPGVAASCWGGGPMARAVALGFGPSSWQFQLSTGPWPFLAVSAVLIVVWLAFGRAAERALQEELDLRRSIGS